MNNITFRTQLEAGAKGDKGDQGVNFVVPTGGILAIEGEIPEGYEETDPPSGGGGSAAYSGEDTPSDNFGENGDIYFQILDKFLMSYATSQTWENVSITKQSDGSYTIVTSGKGVSAAEYVSYAISNLTIGKEYTISFDAQINAEARFYNQGRTYGVIFADNATDYNASLGASSGAWDAINQYQSFYRDTNSHSYECTFTATATTMYFIIGYADVVDGTDDTLTISNINMDIYNEIKSIWTKKEGTWVKYNETIVLPEEMFQPIIYSLEEREVGVWIDNKPLYQKSYPLNTTLRITQSGLDITSYIDNESVIEQIINARGNNTSTADNQATNLWVGRVSSSLLAYNSEGSDVDVITLWYTKTTDTAGSGDYNNLGVPMKHYDYDEHVIGTDENGNTLYERSFDLSTKVLTDNAWNNDILNTDGSGISIRKYEGYFNLGDSQKFSYNYFGSSTEFFTAVINGDKLNVRPNINAGATIYAGRVVIEYTKTS